LAPNNANEALIRFSLSPLYARSGKDKEGKKKKGKRRKRKKKEKKEETLAEEQLYVARFSPEGFSGIFPRETAELRRATCEGAPHNFRRNPCKAKAQAGDNTESLFCRRHSSRD